MGRRTVQLQMQDGVVLQAARRGKERTYPELVGGPTIPSKVGGARHGSGGPLVCRDQVVRVTVGQGQSVAQDNDLAEAR